MDTDAIVSIVAIVIAAGVAAWALYSKGQPVTLEAAQEAYTESQSLATELAQVATMAVAASQQLKETGKIDTGDAAYKNAFDTIHIWFPDLNEKIIATAVEGAYHLYKTGRSAVVAQPVVVNVPAVPVVVIDPGAAKP